MADPVDSNPSADPTSLSYRWGDNPLVSPLVGGLSLPPDRPGMVSRLGTAIDNALSGGMLRSTMLPTMVAPAAIMTSLYRGLRATPELAQSIMQGPGDVLLGDKRPAAGYDPLAPQNELSVPAYAADLAGLGLGVNAPGMMVGGGAVDRSTLGSIPFWQGTPVDTPFTAYENRFLGSGEGVTIPSLKFSMAHGHHLTGMPWIAADYRRAIAGSGKFNTKGAVVHGEIIPDQEDLLGWHDEFGTYTPELQSKLLNGEHSYVFDHNDPRSGMHSWDKPEDLKGSQIYERTADAINQEHADRGVYLDHTDKQRLTSEYFDSIGVPGLRSRNISRADYPPATLFDMGEPGFAYDQMPSLFYTKVQHDPMGFYANHIEPYGMDLDKTVDSFASQLESDAARMRQERLSGTGTGHDWDGYGPDEYENAAEWARKQHRKGELALAEGVTPTSYIMFDGRHINITHWNGVPVKKSMPVHDPSVYEDEQGNAFRLGHGPEAPPGLSPSEQNAWDQYFNHGVPQQPPTPVTQPPASTIPVAAPATNPMIALWNKHVPGAPTPDMESLKRWYANMQSPAKNYSGIPDPGDLTLEAWLDKQKAKPEPKQTAPKAVPASTSWTTPLYPADHPHTINEMKEYEQNPEAYKAKYPNMYKEYIEPHLPSKFPSLTQALGIMHKQDLWEGLMGKGVPIPSHEELDNWYKIMHTPMKSFSVTNDSGLLAKDWIKAHNNMTLTEKLNKPSPSLGEVAVKQYGTDPDFKNKYESIYNSHLKPSLSESSASISKMIDEPY